MKLPKTIKDAIIKSGKYNQMAIIHNSVVREWLMKNAGDMCWEDSLIDALELGNDGSEELIMFLENDCNGVISKFTE